MEGVYYRKYSTDIFIVVVFWILLTLFDKCSYALTPTDELKQAVKRVNSDSSKPSSSANTVGDAVVPSDSEDVVKVQSGSAGATGN